MGFTYPPPQKNQPEFQFHAYTFGLLSWSMVDPNFQAIG